MPRQWYQFSVRTLLILTALLGLFLGVEVRRARQLRSTMRAVIALDGTVVLDRRLFGQAPFPLDDDSAAEMGEEVGVWTDESELARLRFMQKIVGISLVELRDRDVDLSFLDGAPALTELELYGLTTSSRGLERIGQLSHVAWLGLRDTILDQPALAHLKNLRNLESLNLTESNVTDAGLAFVAHLPRLRNLELGATSITDAGIKHVAMAKELRTLRLSETGVSDECLNDLKSLPNLEVVTLSGTRVTQQGVDELKRAKPGIRVICNRKAQ